MKKRICGLVFLCLLISVCWGAAENFESWLKIKSETDGHYKKGHRIKYLKPDEEISSPMMFSSSGFIYPEAKNYIYAIKEADENHVRVVSRRNGLTYPDLEECFHCPIVASRDFLSGKLNGKWGVINTQGKIILPFRYDYQVIHTNYDYLIAVDRAIKEKDNPFYIYDARVYDLRKYAVIDRDGNFIIPFKYTYIKPVNEKYFCVRDDYDANKKAEGKPLSAIYETNGYKLINLKDEDILSEKYMSITYISDDVIICLKDVREPQGVARYSKIVNIKGETLFDPGKNIQIQPVGYSIKNGRNTEHVFSHKFFILNTYRNVYQSSVKNSLIDIKGNVIIDDYESCEFTEKNMIFRDDKKMTMLDYEGNIIKTEIRDCTLSLINGGYIMIDVVNKNENDRRYGFMDWRGNERVKRDYEKILRPTGVSSDDTDYIAFIKEGQTLVLNLQNYGTKLYAREAEMIDKSGKIFYSVEEKTVFEGREVTSHKFIPIE